MAKVAKEEYSSSLHQQPARSTATASIKDRMVVKYKGFLSMVILIHNRMDQLVK